MTCHPRFRPGGGLIVLCLLSWPSAAAAQDQDAAFRRGLDARGDRRWSEVVREMRIVIAQQPKESARRVGSRLGLGGTEYMPYYLLGEALFELNDCAGAVEAWAQSDQQGVVHQKEEFANRIRTGYKACAAKGILLPSEFAPLSRGTTQVYNEANALAQRVAESGKANLDLWRAGGFNEEYERARRELENANQRLQNAARVRLASEFNEARAATERGVAILKPLEARFNATVANYTSVQQLARQVEQAITAADALDQAVEGVKAGLTPQLAASRREAQNQLAQARERLAAGQRTQSQSAVTEAGKFAAAASTVLTGLLEEAKTQARGVRERQIAEAVDAATQAFAFVDSSFANLDRLTVEKANAVKPELAAEREAIQKEVLQLQRRFERARKAEDIAAIQATIRGISDALGRLDALIKSFGPVTLRDRGVVAALEDGARLFFGGEYQQALDTLTPGAGLTNVPLQLHVHLFRAASLFGLYVRSGESNQSLRQQAAAEIERCKQLDAAFVPDARAFSPRFIAFYQNGGAASQTAAATASPR